MSNDINEKDLPDSGLLDLVKPKWGMKFASPPATDVTPEAESTETTQRSTQTTVTQPEVIEYTKPDGSIGQEELPIDPVERKKKIAELASGRDAYLAGREIVKEKAPEIADEWRQLLKGQQEILNKVVETQQAQQQNQKLEPADMLTDDQRQYYEYVKERGDEREAEAYLKNAYNQNLMIYDMQKKIDEQNKVALQQRFNAKAVEFRQLDPTLSNPQRGGKDAESFMQQFNSGYGGWLVSQGFSPEQIWLSDNIDHETLHNAYLIKTGQSKKDTTQSQTPVKTVEVAKATIAPEVAKSIQDVARGSVSASIGGDDDFARYRKAHGRAALRNLNEQDGGKLMDAFMEQTGIAKFLPKRKQAK